jgi:MoaA/NifB/PqqE/SkfB family radical SAM enzyme
MKFTRIYRDPVIKKIIWTPGTVCNYRCSYCYPHDHDGKYKWPKTYDRLIEFVNEWRGHDPLTIDILGGEPTLWPKFKDFCHDLVNSSPNLTRIMFSSNGSRSLRYWQEFDAPVDSLGLSFHPEYADIEHFLKVIELLHERYQVWVYLMLVPPHLDTVKKLFEELKRFKVNATVNSIVSISELHAGVVGNDPEYEKFAAGAHLRQSEIFNGIPYGTYITDGIQTTRIQTQDLINTKQDAFKGWDCYIGRDTLNIKPNGDVYGSSCASGPCYGNIYSQEKIVIPNIPFSCPHNFCGCGTDIEIEKIKVK